MTMHWPQITTIVLMTISLTGNLVLHGKPKDEEYNFFSSLISGGITLWILISGGFFG